MPKLSEGSFVIGIVRLTGTDLDESLRYNTRMEQMLLREFPDEVERVWCRCGTAEVATDPMGPEETDMFITLRPRQQWTKAATQTELADRIRDLFKDLPGQRISVTQPIEQRMDEMTSGVKAQVAVKLFGDDFTTLKDTADKLADVLRKVPGRADVAVEQITGLPVLQIQVKQAELARYNVTARAVLDVVESIGGKPLGEVIEGQLRFPLAIRLPEYTRSSPQALAALTLTTPSGERLPLSRLADLRVLEGPAEIAREWSQRRITVQCNVTGRDLGGFVAERNGASPPRCSCRAAVIAWSGPDSSRTWNALANV